MILCTGEGKRDKILRAAAEIFSKKGFHQARIEDISKEAGIGKGTVYEYFSSKEALFKDMLEHVSQQHFKTLHDRANHEGSVTEQIKNILIHHFKFIGEQRNVGRLLIESHFSLGKETHRWLWELQLEKIRDLADIIREAVVKGELRNDVDTYMAAHFVFGAIASISGMIIMEAIPQEKLEDLAEDTLDLVLSGLKIKK